MEFDLFRIPLTFTSKFWAKGLKNEDQGQPWIHHLKKNPPVLHFRSKYQRNWDNIAYAIDFIFSYQYIDFHFDICFWKPAGQSGVTVTASLILSNYVTLPCRLPKYQNMHIVLSILNYARHIALLITFNWRSSSQSEVTPWKYLIWTVCQGKVR